MLFMHQKEDTDQIIGPLDYSFPSVSWLSILEVLFKLKAYNMGANMPWRGMIWKEVMWSELIWEGAGKAEKAEFDCKTYVPKEKALTDSEIDALKIYPEPPEDVDVTTGDVDADIYFQ